MVRAGLVNEQGSSPRHVAGGERGRRHCRRAERVNARLAVDDQVDPIGNDGRLGCLAAAQRGSVARSTGCLEGLVEGT